MTQTTSKRGYWISALIVLILVIAALVIWKKQDPQTLDYKEFKVERGNLEVRILSSGSVQPENRLEIKPPIVGRVESVLIEEGQNVKKGQILAWMSSSERAALLDAARSKGREELRHWESLYRATPILAPIDGMVILRNVESGQSFSSNDAIMVMSNRLAVKAQVDETDIAQIKLQSPVDIILDAYANQKIPGIVEHIAFEAKTISNVTTYIVDVLPKTIPAFMRSGMTANLSFLVESKTQVLLLPNEAIKVDDERPSVLIRHSADEAPTLKEIEIGVSNGMQTEIISGLDEYQVVYIIKPENKGKKSNGSNPLNPMGGGRRKR